MTYWISPHGDDAWTGGLPEPNSSRDDGPFATIDGALRRIRAARRDGTAPGPARALLRGGRYELAVPVCLGPDDGAITFCAHDGETPVLSGARAIENWRETTRNGSTVWTADLPRVNGEAWEFRALWNAAGERLPRARLPKTGFFHIEDIPGTPLNVWANARTSRFVYAGSDLGGIEGWRNQQDMEVVAYSLWLDHRLSVASVEPESRTITLTNASERPLVDDAGKRYARYFLENVFEALSQPGEWYLDRSESRLYYVPRPDETPGNTRLFAPVTTQLLRVQGDFERAKLVEWLRFEGLTWEHADWQPLDASRPGHGQAAWKAPGALFFEGARFCALEDCTLRHLGGYGVEIGAGCHGVRVVGCAMHDLAAGGVHLSGGTPDEAPERRTGACQITDNHIHDYGRVWARGIGILCRHSGGNALAHNHIHHGYYSAISVGWVWGYAPSAASDNRIEANHIHDIGQGLLSDMGGIYLLGVAPGTVVRGNHIHDIRKYHYGGWAIYADEGSSHVLIENNLCHDTNDAPFNQHYGRENIVRNNIFAFGGETMISLGNARDGHRQFSLTRNILLSDGAAFFRNGYAHDLSEPAFESDLNLFFSRDGEARWTTDWRSGRADGHAMSPEAWRATGRDRFSRIADPLFEDTSARDFRLKPDSPALQLGFVPFDVTQAGPRPPGARPPLSALTPKPR